MMSLAVAIRIGIGFITVPSLMLLIILIGCEIAGYAWVWQQLSKLSINATDYGTGFCLSLIACIIGIMFLMRLP